MAGKAWSEKEIAVLSEPIPAREAAAKIGRSVMSVERARTARGIKSTFKKPAALESTRAANATLAEDIAKKDEAYWEASFKSVNTKYEKLLKEQNVIERLVSRIADLAPVRYEAAPRIIHTGRAESGKPQSAVLMFSDTHVGKNVKPSQTLGFGEYNFQIFLARLKYLEESVISIVENHINTAIPELVVAMMGDMLDGTLVHSNESGQVDPIFNQFYAGAHAIAQFFRNLSAHFPKLRIYDTVGNHPRFQNQHRMPTKNRYSNFDKFLYALVREMLRDIPNIEWTLDAQPYQIFEVQKFVCFIAHGDSLRGGDKALGIPNHGVGRLVSAATQLMNKYSLKAPNYYMVGHLHRDIVLPHASGSFLVNGGFPGIDEFGLAEMFTPVDASQKFFFIHPQYGKTASYDISLKYAKITERPPYTIPGTFEMH